MQNVERALDALVGNRFDVAIVEPGRVHEQDRRQNQRRDHHQLEELELQIAVLFAVGESNQIVPTRLSSGQQSSAFPTPAIGRSPGVPASRSILLCLAFVLHARSGASAAGAALGRDAEGGAPYVEADPNNPQNVSGFDVEIAALIAESLGRTPQFLQVAFASLDQSAIRGDFDIGLSGIEDTPARRATVAGIDSLLPSSARCSPSATADRDGTARSPICAAGGSPRSSGTIAYDLLLAGRARARRHRRLLRRRRASVLGPAGRARRRGAARQRPRRARDAAQPPGSFIEPAPVQTGALRRHHRRRATASCATGSTRRSCARDAGRAARADHAQVERVERRPAAALRRAGRGGDRAGAQAAAPAAPRRRHRARDDAALPAVAAARRGDHAGPVVRCRWRWRSRAGCCSRSGASTATRSSRLLLTAYVEVMRGTPVLLQLFVIYYGLSGVIRLPAFMAALLGLGLNYAAYESEIYRSALEAVPRGQLEAARILGFTERQTLRLIRGPQAFRLALAPMTNDFVALLKDSSLVSVHHRRRADEADADLRREHRQLGDPGAAVRGALPRAVAAAGAAGAPARRPVAERRRHERWSWRCADLRLQARHARHPVAASTSPSPRGEMLALMGLSGLRQDDDPARGRRARELPRRRGAGGRRGPAEAAGDRAAQRALERKVGMVFQFHFLFEHLTAIHNVWLAPVHVHGAAASGGRDARAGAARGARRRPPRQRAAARAVGRRGAARGDRARAGRRSAAAADGRADRVARSGAPQRARRDAAGAGGAGPHAGDDLARRRLRPRLRDRVVVLSQGCVVESGVRARCCRTRSTRRRGNCCRSSARASRRPGDTQLSGLVTAGCDCQLSRVLYLLAVADAG